MPNSMCMLLLAALLGMSPFASASEQGADRAKAVKLGMMLNQKDMKFKRTEAVPPCEPATMSYESRPSTYTPTSDADAENEWKQLAAVPPPDGYCKKELTAASGFSNYHTCDGSSAGKDIAWHFAASWPVLDAGTWEFQFKTDNGRGGFLEIDGVPQTDLLGDESWYTPQTIAVTLKSGQHTLDFFGFENCCDGDSSISVKPPGASTFAVFTTEMFPCPTCKPAMMSYESRPSTYTPTSDADAENEWKQLAAVPPPDGYCKKELTAASGFSNYHTCDGSSAGKDIAWHFAASWPVVFDAGTWEFQFKTDNGRGGFLEIDGVPQTDLLGDESWYTPQTIAVTLKSGQHTLDFFGFENCCDGDSSISVKPPGASTFEVFTTEMFPCPDASEERMSVTGTVAVASTGMTKVFVGVVAAMVTLGIALIFRAFLIKAKVAQPQTQYALMCDA